MNKQYFGGPYTVAVIRIGIAVSLLWSTSRVAQAGPVAAGANAPMDVFRAVGALLFSGQPSVATIQLILIVTQVAGVCMLLGVASRVSAALATLGFWVLASYDAAFTLPWSHSLSAPAIASLFFLGARSGDALSVDAWVRQRRKLAPHRASAYAYQWPVTTVVISLSLMFVMAGVSKLYMGGPKQAWIFSDNLRNQIAASSAMRQVPRTPLAEWLIAEPWRYQSAALVNTLAQLSPLSMLVWIRRPWIRLGVGLVILTEVTGLGHVMGLGFHNLLPLLVAFVDWDRLWQRFSPTKTTAHTALPAALANHQWHARLVVALLTAYVVNGLALNQRLMMFPFSGFPMYAKLRVAAPYDQHLPFDNLSGSYTIAATPELPAHELARINQHLTYRKLWTQSNPDIYRNTLKALRAEVSRAYPQHQLHEIQFHKIANRIPAWPAAPDPTVVTLELLAAQRPDGSFYGTIFQ